MNKEKAIRNIQKAAEINNLDEVKDLIMNYKIPLEIKKNCLRIGIHNSFDEIIKYFCDQGINVSLDELIVMARSGHSLFIELFDRAYPSLLYDNSESDIFWNIFRSMNVNDKVDIESINKIYDFLIKKKFKVSSVHLDSFVNFVDSNKNNTYRILQLLKKIDKNEIEKYQNYIDLLKKKEKLELMTHLL